MRLLFLLAAVLHSGAWLHGQEAPEAKARRVRQAQLERIPTADLGNGYYRNPILVGTGSDNSVVRVGKDFYMIAGGGAMPSELVWHSRDLVNWRPVTRAMHRWDGGNWASEITYYKGRYYIYTTPVDPRRDAKPGLSLSQRSLLGVPLKDQSDKAFKNVVMWADDPAGPWSDPIAIGVYGLFDPGHIADQQGTRYLYFNKGMMIRLAPDGLGTVGDLKIAYNGWEYPKDWAAECMCLEAPKLAFHNGYYYLSAAQGGTGGPSTAHMGVIARSRSVEGPWENSPYNPMVRTASRLEKWWRQGHGTLIDDAEGNWWFLYTGYEKDFTYYGKQGLLLPVEWTADGWPRVVPGVAATDTIRKPAGDNVGHGMPLSDDFSSSKVGIQWTYDSSVDPSTAFRFGEGKLVIHASGSSQADARMLNVTPVNHAYEAEVEIEIPDGAEGGLMMTAGRGGGPGAFAAAGIRKGQLFAKWPSVPNLLKFEGNRVFVRIRNDYADITCKYSRDGKERIPFPNSSAVPAAGRISLYAAGQGEVTFRNFKYRGLD